jgi:hypothetical protein
MLVTVGDGDGGHCVRHIPGVAAGAGGLHHSRDRLMLAMLADGDLRLIWRL